MNLVWVVDKIIIYMTPSQFWYNICHYFWSKISPNGV